MNEERPRFDKAAAPPLDLEDLRHDGRQALSSLGPIDLIVGEREFVSLIGHASCGSSQFLAMIAGLLPAQSGHIHIRGAEASGVRTNVGLVSSRPVLLPWRNVIQNVLIDIELRGRSAAEHRSRARRLLAAIGLPDAEGRHPRSLAPEDQHRVLLCRALINEPDLLLLDRPFAGTDGLARENLLTDLQRFMGLYPVATLMATSHISEAVLLSDRVAVMTGSPGRIVQQIRIEIPRPRRLDRETLPQVMEYSARLRTSLQGHGILL